MLLSEIKKTLKRLDTIEFQLPNGALVPKHFHVTEVGKVSRHFIDCGGTERHEVVINFQLWTADDYEHRLSTSKLSNIIALSEQTLQLEDAPVEVEYQGNTIGKYDLDFNGTHFLLIPKQTDCLAKDHCGIPEQKPKKRLSELQATSCCDPSSGCC